MTRFATSMGSVEGGVGAVQSRIDQLSGQDCDPLDEY